MEDRHDRKPTRRPSHHSPSRSGRRRGASAHEAAAALEARSFHALHSPDAGQVSDAARQPALRDGAQARLPGESKPLPQHDRPRAAEACGRGLSAVEDPSRRAGPDRLGPLRQGEDRSRGAPVDGLRDGSQLLATHLPALLPERADEQLPAWSHRRLRGVAGRAPRTLVRQPEVLFGVQLGPHSIALLQ